MSLFKKGFAPEAGHGANNGLAVARDILEKIHQKHPEISYGDLWTLAGVCAVQELVSFFVTRLVYSGAISNNNKLNY